MKTIITSILCLLLATMSNAQRSSATITQVGGITNSTTTTQQNNSNTTNYSNNRTEYNVGSFNSNTYSNQNNTTNDNSYNNNYYNNNSNSNNYWNTNNNSSWNNNNNSWNNSNNNWNGNNNNWNNNTYYSNNNNNYNSYNTQNKYTVKDDGYGSKEITEDNEKLTPYVSPYNVSNMFSNYRNNTPIEKLFKQTQKPSQLFIINAQQENTIKTTGNTVLKIAPNSFLDKNGEVVKGDVEFEVKEMYSKSDMILSNAHTVSNDMVLKSGGELFLGAEKNGQPLVLANNKPISIEMPAEGQEPMQLFNGKPDRNTVNWNLANNQEVSPALNTNSPTGYSYNFTANNMNWLNCDRFMPRTEQNTKINVRLDKQFDTTNTAIFIVYRDQNTVAKFDGFSTYDGTNRMLPQQSLFETKWYSVPAGTHVNIIAISEINGQHYFNIQSTIIQKNHVMDMMMYPTTLDEIKTTLQQNQ